MKTKNTLAISAIFLSALIFACSSGKLTVDQTFKALKPVKEIMTPKDAPVNLIIRVKNVADEASSYKNTVDIRVNGKRIMPAEPVTNIQREFVFKLKLRPGYYRVEGNYYNSGGWDMETFKLQCHDLAKVMADKVTILTAELQKNPDGSLTSDEAYFNEEYESLTATIEENTATVPLKTREEIVKRVPVHRALAPHGKRSNIKAQQETKVKKSEARPWNSVMLHISTEPEICLINLDDLPVGQSPLAIPVNRNEDHILQISKDGYRGVTKILDHSLFKDEQDIRIVQRLEQIKD